MKKSVKLNLDTAFKYPFNRGKRMWNILWLLFPIFGWFALGGYVVRIIQEFSKGKFKQLPKMKFGDDMGLGFMMFLKAIPFILVYALIAVILETIPGGMIVDILLRIFVLPVMFIHFFNKGSVGSLFEFDILESVFGNIGDYIVAMLKDIFLAVIFLIMWIILVGLPAGVFTQSIFIADFYRRRIR